MLTSTALTRRRRQMYRRIRAAVTARRISAAAQPAAGPAEDSPPAPRA